VIIVAALFSGCAYAGPSPAPTIPPSLASLDSQARMFIDQGAVAVVVQVRWPGGEWSNAYGVRDLETMTPAQPGDRVPIASATETMTAVTVLRLVDDGLIGLDSPVNDVIPGFAAALKPPGPIMVRQLLNHTSGLPEFNDALPQDPDFRPLLTQPMSMERALQLAGTLPWMASRVGEFHLSNTNYMALGLLVQTLRHRPFAEVLREEVIEPLRLGKTSLDHLDGHAADLVHGYVTLRGERIDVTDNTGDAGSPASGAVSTVGDVNTFFAALFQGRLLTHESFEEMKKSPYPGLPYGLGVWKHADACSSSVRFEGRGSFWNQQTVATASGDGAYEAVMSVSMQPLPSPLEDPDAAGQRDLLNKQVESQLNETLDRLCQQ
jgi:D-alanyl-D-alanine carboxypeptidase